MTLTVRCRYCDTYQDKGRDHDMIMIELRKHERECTANTGGFFVPLTKPKVVIDHGYYYLTCQPCDEAHPPLGYGIGLKNLVAAMNIAALHYENRHKRILRNEKP